MGWDRYDSTQIETVEILLVSFCNILFKCLNLYLYINLIVVS